jgi:hypothetical protein
MGYQMLGRPTTTPGPPEGDLTETAGSPDPAVFRARTLACCTLRSATRSRWIASRAFGKTRVGGEMAREPISIAKKQFSRSG